MTDPIQEAEVQHARTSDPRRIVVVGPCASGKSTLVQALRDYGYDAHVSGQEHSEIGALWQRLGPDVLIALQVDSETISQRRGWHWPKWLHETQNRRLAPSLSAADLVVDTSRGDIETMVDRVIAFLRQTGPG